MNKLGKNTQQILVFQGVNLSTEDDKKVKVGKVNHIAGLLEI